MVEALRYPIADGAFEALMIENAGKNEAAEALISLANVFGFLLNSAPNRIQLFNFGDGTALLGHGGSLMFGPTN